MHEKVEKWPAICFFALDTTLQQAMSGHTHTHTHIGINASGMSWSFILEGLFQLALVLSLLAV